jgi:hypothetical protein
MKKMISRLGLFLIFHFTFKNAQSQTFFLISNTSGNVNMTTIKKLPPQLHALAAYYSAIGGTKCTEHTCLLTTALGLGDQGSKQQIDLIQKYFPEDKVAKMLCSQNCYQPPDSSATYSNFNYLNFVIEGEIVQVNYQLTVYEKGHVQIYKGPDLYTFKNHVFREKKRVLYAWVDK